MKKIILVLILFIGLFYSIQAEARTTKVNGYYKPSTNKYVQPYYRSSPNKTKIDNYSTKGNYNPYTGKKGTVNLFKW